MVESTGPLPLLIAMYLGTTANIAMSAIFSGFQIIATAHVVVSTGPLNLLLAVAPMNKRENSGLLAAYCRGWVRWVCVRG